MITDYPELEKVLRREYTSFFKPMEKQFYDQNVQFIDPLTNFIGIDKYANNVDMLSGRTTLGKILFEDANINLHNIIQLSKNQLQTRWTLKVTVKAIPWKPRAVFTGVSIYTLNTQTNKIIKQDDYWDSINLINGKYTPVSFSLGLSDFLGQLKKEQMAEIAGIV